MLKVIITGWSGVGKTTLLNALAKEGYQTIGCDQIARDLYQNPNLGYQKIVQNFGAHFVNQKEVDKKFLRQQIIEKKLDVNQLNQLIHPLIEKVLIQSDFDFCECPIVSLFNLDRQKYKIIKLIAPQEVVLKRLIDFRALKKSEALFLLNLYQDRDDVDLVIDFSQEFNQKMVDQVLQFVRKYIKC